ncbi:MAG TPA: hypothetical protein PK453_13270 [Leptospiraceae bacterium]|nr:hypothetical protein [Leptospiraceae bacterium]HMY66552.1 hypothetical protein [Leptospiraceae bacterium]HNF14635.1 hypothetical protein [Leptospiraceae bacterium]HNF28390.1 hypothetical protein [Leptospiraceae bacterium]HNH06917.1 hypothetical protein [Leptospiraceae bacterium]
MEDRKTLYSWLGLAPNNKISDDKILQRGTVKLKSRAASLGLSIVQSPS